LVSSTHVQNCLGFIYGLKFILLFTSTRFGPSFLCISFFFLSHVMENGRYDLGCQPSLDFKEHNDAYHETFLTLQIHQMTPFHKTLHIQPAKSHAL